MRTKTGLQGWRWAVLSLHKTVQQRARRTMGPSVLKLSGAKE